MAALAVVLAMLMPTDALAQSRTFYGSSGRVLGCSITDSDGATTCRTHQRRTSAGGDTMTIYGADGRVIATVTKPQGK